MIDDDLMIYRSQERKGFADIRLRSATSVVKQTLRKTYSQQITASRSPV